MIIKLFYVNDTTDEVIDSWMVVTTSIDAALDNAAIAPDGYHLEYKVITRSWL